MPQLYQLHKSGWQSLFKIGVPKQAEKQGIFELVQEFGVDIEKLVRFACFHRFC